MKLICGNSITKIERKIFPFFRFPFSSRLNHSSRSIQPTNFSSIIMLQTAFHFFQASLHCLADTRIVPTSILSHSHMSSHVILLSSLRSQWLTQVGNPSEPSDSSNPSSLRWMGRLKSASKPNIFATMAKLLLVNSVEFFVAIFI